MLKVLIVEDDPMVMDINTKFLLKVDGFELKGKASSIKSAKAILEKEEFNLVLLDVFLPDGNGIELLKWIREEDIKIDTILITAENSKGAVDDAFRFGATDYLIKPFKFTRFKEALENYKKRVCVLEEISDFNQEYIDSYILNMRSSNDSIKEDNYQKGVNRNTYEKIIGYLMVEGSEMKTAEEVADGIGLSRVTVRRYLEKMAEEDKVEIIQEYGKIGRPTNYYRMKK